MERYYVILQRVKNWLHDTIMILGFLCIFLACGGARLAGYYFDFALVPMELTEKIARK